MTDTPNTDVLAARALSEHPCYRATSAVGGRLSHRHWSHANELMPTCERCGTPIDREHKETGPVSWEPEKRPEVVTLADRYALSNAAMNALAEWLAWPDTGRDVPREVTVQQTLSFLRGLPNTLGYGKHTTPQSDGTAIPVGERDAMRAAIHNDAVIFDQFATQMFECWHGTGKSMEDGSASNDYRVWGNEAHNRARDLRGLLREFATAPKVASDTMREADCNCAARYYGDDRNAHQLSCAALSVQSPAAGQDGEGVKP